jgi:hypothetical protein
MCAPADGSGGSVAPSGGPSAIVTQALPSPDTRSVLTTATDHSATLQLIDIESEKTPFRPVPSA